MEQIKKKKTLKTVVKALFEKIEKPVDVKAQQAELERIANELQRQNDQT